MLWQLIKKELHLQRSAFWFVGAIAAIWSALFVMGGWAETALIAKQLTMAQLVSLLQAFFVGPCMIVIAPLLIGAATLAEERRMGAWDWQLSLPASRAGQWAVKMAVAAIFTLILALALEPLLDRLLEWRIANRGGRIPTLSSFPEFAVALHFAPLILMASAAYASSLASDPYKAFFSGALIFVFISVCYTFADPHWLMLDDIPLLDNHVLQGQVSAIALLLTLAGIVAGTALRNFQFEGFRWRRLIAQLAAIGALTIAAAWLAICWQFRPICRISQRAKDVEPFIQSLRAGQNQKNPIPWDLVTPLIVKRGLTVGAVPRQASSEAYGIHHDLTLDGSFPFIADIWRSPNAGKAVIDLRLLQLRKGACECRWHRYVEIDIQNGKLTSLGAAAEEDWRVFPPNLNYAVCEYLMGQWRPPFGIDAYLGRKASSSEFRASASSSWKNLSTNLNTKTIWVDRVPYAMGFNNVRLSSVCEKGGIYELLLTTDDHRHYDQLLIKELSPLHFTMVDRKADGMQFCLSTDGRWYARETCIYRGVNNEIPPALTVCAVDHSTSWTIPRNGGNLHLNVMPPRYFRESSLSFSEYDWNFYNNRLNLSPDGRYLPFIRSHPLTWTTQAQEAGGGRPATTDSRTFEFSMFDLQTGKEQVYLKTSIDDKKFLSQFCDQEGYLYLSWPLCSMIWARQGNEKTALTPNDKLALMFHDKLYLVTTDSLSQTRQAAQAAPGNNDLSFHCSPPIDLSGFLIDRYDFWDANTILVLGKVGLFKIEIAKVIAPPWERGRPRPQDAR